MAYRLNYSDYSTASGPPNPAAWVGPAGPQGVPGPVGPQGIPGPMPPLDYPATGGTTVRSAQDRAADVVNVLDYGGDATGVADSLAAFNAAAACAPSGQDVTIVVPRGIYNMSAAFTGNGRNVTLQIAAGVTWTGFATPYYGVRAEYMSGTARQIHAEHYNSGPLVPSALADTVVELGPQAGTAWSQAFTYIGTPPAGQPWQSVPLTLFFRWDTLTAASSYALAMEHRLGLFPLVGGGGSGAIAEWNPVNRAADPGWNASYGANHNFGGLAVIPETDYASGGPAYGYHTQNAFAAAPCSHTNTVGYKPQTYNAFIAYHDAVAPGGTVIYAGGDTSGTQANYPYSVLRIDHNFLHGIITDPTFVSNDGAIIRTQPANGIVWDDGTGTASIRGTEVSAGVVNVTIANAGVPGLVVSNSAVTSSYGFTCAPQIASNPFDLSKHLNLFAGQYGISVTSGLLSYISGASHDFFGGGSLLAQVNATAVTSTAAMQIGGASGPTWTTGSAVPSSTQPVGSLYSRVSTWAAGATLYVSKGSGAWTAVASV